MPRLVLALLLSTVLLSGALTAPVAAAPAAVALGGTLPDPEDPGTGEPEPEPEPEPVVVPAPRVTFNNPLGGRDARRAILARINDSVDRAPRGSKIQIFTWNLLSDTATTKLLRAQRRGVTVRLLMDDTNVTRIDNPSFRRLRSGLRAGNRSRPAVAGPSWARLCRGSCRGGTGSAHSKFFMFSKVGRSRNVVIQGSANYTEASANNQWNDVVTHRRDPGVYAFWDRIFQEATRDERAASPYLAERIGDVEMIAFPLNNRPDPVMDLLDQVRCNGALNTDSGRTRIRIAPDVVRRGRGMDLAVKVRELWDAGCDVRLGYTVMGIDVGKMLREDGPRGPLPMRQLTQDRDGDGEFDNYFHLKAMTVVGRVGDDPSAFKVLNGSANWSGLAAVSDENLAIYHQRDITLAYQNHLQRWYDAFAPRARTTAARTSVPAGVSAPSAAGLVFGTGDAAVWDDGRPYSLTGVDPHASLEED